MKTSLMKMLVLFAPFFKKNVYLYTSQLTKELAMVLNLTLTDYVGFKLVLKYM